MSPSAAATTTPRSVRDVVAYVGPNWFSAVMGTGIVATAAATLPVDAPVLDAIARAAWALASLLLATLGVATVGHWLAHPEVARSHVDHPVMSHFYGAPAMALMTVGSGTLLVGVDLVGPTTAVAADVVLWSLGTVLGLWTLGTIPRRTLSRPYAYTGPAFGGWLMPVVPPMVSAAAGALLVPHLPAPLRPVMVAVCCVLFVVALAASAPLLMIVVRRTVRGDLGPPPTVPTLFIVLGPLGQSATAAHALGDRAGGGWQTLGVVYALPVVVAALTWLAVVVRLTARTVRAGLTFGLTWWSFTFPIGTVVTGTSGLALELGSTALTVLAVILFGLLVAAWSVVAALTVRGVTTGGLLAGPQTP